MNDEAPKVATTEDMLRSAKADYRSMELAWLARGDEIDRLNRRLDAQSAELAALRRVAEAADHLNCYDLLEPLTKPAGKGFVAAVRAFDDALETLAALASAGDGTGEKKDPK